MAVEAIEVALTATIVAQEQAALTHGGLSYQSEKGSRFGHPPQPTDQEYTATVFSAGQQSAITPNVAASFDVHWQGNKFGEMGGAYVQVDLGHTEFWSHGSSLDVKFTVLETMPRSGDDERLWPMVWIYEGTFDPWGPGEYEFQGKFEINAFGGFKVIDHRVADRSFMGTLHGTPPDYVRRGPDIAGSAPPAKPGSAGGSSATPAK